MNLQQFNMQSQRYDVNMWLYWVSCNLIMHTAALKAPAYLFKEWLLFIFTFCWCRVIRNGELSVHRATGLWRDSRWTVRVSPRSYLVSPLFQLLEWWPGSPPSLKRPGRSAGRALCSRHSGACCVHLTLLRERWVRVATPDSGGYTYNMQTSLHIKYLLNVVYVVMTCIIAV